ncbi:MAG: Lysozyme RrrD [Pseudomonas sp.]|nr:MAG: Lysozyme RrrD [Pseudomonas sp.]
MSPLQQRILTASMFGVLGMAGVLVSKFEGRSLVAYLDPVGIPTICYGSTAGVKLGQTKTAEQCEQLLAGELGKACSDVERLVRVPLPASRHAALCSFVYNAGPTAFQSSTLLRKLNAGDTPGACAELSRWVYAKGQKLAGLVNRRAAERELCEVGL